MADMVKVRCKVAHDGRAVGDEFALPADVAAMQEGFGWVEIVATAKAQPVPAKG